MVFIQTFSVCFDVEFREGNEPGDELTVTYRELLQRVCQFANVLKSQGRLKPFNSYLKQRMDPELNLKLGIFGRIESERASGSLYQINMI